MEKTHVLALDPSTKMLYRYNLETHLPIFDKTLTDRHKARIDQELQELNDLCSLDITGWTYKSPEAENYRKRAIWKHLMQSSPTAFPSYTTTRELSSAFSNVTNIKFKVDISQYIGENGFSPEDSLEEINVSRSQKSSIQFSRVDKEITFKASLVTTSNEAIKQMAKMVYKEFRLKIMPKSPENQLVFKVKGKKNFLTGNFPLLAYSQVRATLRGLDYLSVNLTEIPKITKFPPRYLINETENLSNLSNFVIFHSNTEPEEAPKPPRLMKPRIFMMSALNPIKAREEATDRLLKGKKIDTLAFSGECEWPFRVRLCGMENLYNLFAEGFRGSATFNGTEKPEFLVLPKTNEKSREANHARRKSSGSLERRKGIPLVKSKPIKVSTNRFTTDTARSAYINHGPSSLTTLELSTEFGLPLVPYLLSYDLMILYGDVIIKDTLKRTEYSPFNYSPRTMEWVSFGLKVSELPKEARLGVNVYAISQAGQTILLGSCVKPLFDEHGRLREGLQEIKLWPFYRVEARLGCMQEFWGVSTDYMTEQARVNKGIGGSVEYARLYIQFESFESQEVLWSLKDYSYLKCMYKRLAKPYRNSTITIKNKSHLASFHISISGSLGDDLHEEEDSKLIKTKPQIEELAYLEKVLMTDPLEELSTEEKRLLFICRDHYKSLPLALPLFLKSIDWTRPLQVREAYRVLDLWASMKPEDALALINADYPDENVRLYATRRISQLSDEDLSLYTPQLIQALSFEPNHFSPLSEMLLERSLKNPYQVGHCLFWSLRSQLHLKATAERYGLFLEMFIMLSGGYRDTLKKELDSVVCYSNLGAKVAVKDSFQERQLFFKTLVKQDKENFSKMCTLPLDSSMEVQGLETAKSKIMKSKKMPLFLMMNNSEASAGTLPIIVKNGDDLRQDILTLQMIRVMDTIWLENGLDLRMKPYQVVATGDQSGIIEVVKDSDTTADIHKKYGGTLGALKNNTLRDYLVDQNPGDYELEKAFDNFIRSCAGYCVATYILGIADRHNGNIMLTKTGHLFHIDFGHFLGNFKKKLGFQRERSKFVFTEEMAHVMDGKGGYRFEIFKEYCCKAYNYSRKHGKRLIHLFLLMISAGMPELKKKEEIKYLREMLSLKLTEKEANSKFTAEIDNALNNAFRRWDNLIHNLKV